MLATAWLGELRLEQWIKNGFVLAPLVFSLQMTDGASLFRASATFLSFGFAASGTYAINDLRDLPEDRKHPLKSKRPIAAGLITPTQAITATVVLWVAAAVISWLVNVATICYVFAYVALNILYSSGLKKVPILDVLLLAAGYVVRVLAGSAAVGVIATPWILTVTFFIALVLGFGKRRSEIFELVSNAADCREVLGSYTIPLLDSFILVSVASTIITYALYIVESSGRLGDGSLILTLPFVVFGLFRYLFLLHRSSAGSNPTKAVTTDRPLALTILGWVLTVVISLYLT
jgi:4-hydroxybenzoate polyprenyltransferase